MSDNKFYKAIPKDAVIDVKVEGSFYADLKAVFNSYIIEGESKESIGLILEHLNEAKITSIKEHRLYLMYVMIAQIETEAIRQGHVEEKPLNLQAFQKSSQQTGPSE
jgi:hypothetical protein